MKIKTTVYLLLAMCLAACSDNDSDNVLPNQNYVQFSSGDNESLTVYQATDLNNSVAEFSRFCYGTSCLTGSTDTLVSLSATIDNYSLSIQFPLSSKPQSYNICRSPLVSSLPYATFSKDLLYHYTTKYNPASSNLSKISRTIGQIDVIRCDSIQHLVEGTFLVWCYAYKIDGEYLNPVNDSILIKGCFSCMEPLL